MLVTDSGGFETVSVVDPRSHFTLEFQNYLANADDDVVVQLVDAAAAASDRVFLELKALNLAPDEGDEYSGVPLPIEIVLEGPAAGRDAMSVFDQLKDIPDRWRLDAAMVLEEGLTLVQDERDDPDAE